MTDKGEKKYFSRVGLIFSVALSYAGLGNIWRFPYLVGKYGGAAFLVPYLIFVLAIGWLGMLIEWSMGKYYRSGLIKSFYLRDPRMTGCGAFVALLSGAIMIYYAVLAGYALTYAFYSVTGFKGLDPSELWNSVTSGTNPVVWIAWAITLLVSYFVVGRGVKAFDFIGRILGPLLICIMLILVVNSLRLPGSFEGVKFYVKPNFAFLKEPIVWIMALTQVFWSIGPGWGNAFTLACKTKEEEEIPFSALTAALGDTTYALLAGWIIFPAIFAYGISPSKGPSLLFIAMTTIFKDMAGGAIFGFFFFLCVWFLALTSIYTVGNELFTFTLECLGVERKKASLYYTIASFIGGAVYIYKSSLIWAVDTVLGCYGLIFAVLGEVAVAAWAKNKDIEELRVKVINRYGEIYIGRWWNSYIKYVFPLIILVITVWFLYDSRGLTGIDFWSYGAGGLLIALSIFVVCILLFWSRNGRKGR